MRYIVERIGSVGIDLQHHLGERSAHPPDRFDVEPWLDLQLDALVTIGDIAADDIDEFIDGVGNPHGNTDGQRRARLGAVGQKALQRASFVAQLHVEQRHLQRALGHSVALHGLENRGDILGAQRPMGEQAGREVLGDHCVGGVDELAEVQRCSLDRRFAPTLPDVGDHAQQLHLTYRLGAEACAERALQWHLDLADLDQLQLHRRAISIGFGHCTMVPRAADLVLR